MLDPASAERSLERTTDLAPKLTGIGIRLVEMTTDPNAVLPTAPSFSLATSLPSRPCVLIGRAAHATTQHLGQGTAQAAEAAAVLSESIAKDAPVPDARDAFMLRRYEQNRLVVEPSLWTEDRDEHPTPDADFAGLTAKSRDGTAQPT
jgi:2-polyprenyl-6-methoxyphenol hydroxylase-like FAD-dependent oxidoreductase